ncbi:hypothetical protein Sta7437_3600 [Stanieria cyanosphaera PCC 7437]|uniref:DUF7683 domain-containing protein n=1 Tax=Stanieria cyanosphaera (strain ATCC 29371 / PCC 7437) TaxID=111780 RepID=K9XX56_STAC7|nr:hypothetical protein [Stanieria cyanosphaera]AFZ37098.1 hypothetical protein Sta7437_3600 [Stanieria cyanosphaera PCC 7437]
MNSEFLINPKLPNKKHDNTVLDKTEEISKPKIDRVLRWFEKEGDDLVGEKVISNVNLEHLQKLFGIDSENPMYDCYLVESPEQINYLQNLLNLELDTKSYDYLVECDMVKPTSVISIKYKICLLINLEGDPNRGGYLIVDEFNENPGLSKDDRFYIKNWKVGYSNSQGLGNLSFDFEVQVMSLQKTLFRHEELLTEIFVESPNREEIKKLVDALRERNPDVIKSSTNN